MQEFWAEMFTWWRGTWGTRLFTRRHGEYVGQDELGNRYYRGRDAKTRERRWVIYNGYAEASAIPPGWHGWMHHRTDTPPSQEAYTPREWQKPHQPNFTGTSQAYRPDGSMLTKGQRPRVTGDYEAWSPE
jgi:NADH:ubiquinone oxidoreductase subunit